jgi:4-amino-4-deoxychorismate lyase
MSEEVLLHNPSGEITEGSTTTPYFYRGGKWVTPPVHAEHGGQRGTTRRWAIRNGLCEEGTVRVESVENGEGVWVSNGVRGFRWGKIVLEL